MSIDKSPKEDLKESIDKVRRSAKRRQKDRAKFLQGQIRQGIEEQVVIRRIEANTNEILELLKTIAQKLEKL
jgi:hypothetical protein